MTDPILDSITGVLCLATIALAGYTAKLRKATVDLALETLTGTRLTDQHHQESLSPICVLKAVKCGLSGIPIPQPGSDRMDLTFVIENVGNGPAFQVNAKIEAVTAKLQPSGLALTHPAGPLKAGSDTLAIGPVSESINTATGFVVRLEYLSVFGTEGFSEWHVSHVGECKLVKQELPAPKERF
jgi:hypothetical protein